jgi:hypothetical protein
MNFCKNKHILPHTPNFCHRFLPDVHNFSGFLRGKTLKIASPAGMKEIEG